MYCFKFSKGEINGGAVNVLITHDGSADAESALRYGALKVRENGGGKISLYIFKDAGFGEVDYSSPDRTLDDLCRQKSSGPFELKVLIGKGDPEREILDHLQQEEVDLIVTVPSCTAFLRGSSIPVSPVPATILAPMDDRVMQESMINHIAGEALSSCSRVLLLGIVPIHLYNPSEETELDAVKAETIKSMELAAAELNNRGIQVEEMLRLGYPDEEIIRTAETSGASMIIIPCDSDQQSELNKAASIILDELKQVNIPVLYVPVQRDKRDI
jgi:nucleotide-binding universal stress UspA family protein